MRLLRCHQNMRGPSGPYRLPPPTKGSAAYISLGKERLAREGKPPLWRLAVYLGRACGAVTPECADRPSRAPKNPPPFREEQGMSRPLPAQIA